jgi:Protein of unknown function (DUF2798)
MMKKLPPRAMAIVMPLILSIFMSAIVSFIATLKALGFSSDLAISWLKAWGLSWAIAFPTLLVVLPAVRWLAGLVVEQPGKG